MTHKIIIGLLAFGLVVTNIRITSDNKRYEQHEKNTREITCEMVNNAMSRLEDCQTNQVEFRRDISDLQGIVTQQHVELVTQEKVNAHFSKTLVDNILSQRDRLDALEAGLWRD